MPTKIYTKQKIASIGYEGVEYTVKDGAVDVPDQAVASFCESHGFTREPLEDAPVIAPVLSPAQRSTAAVKPVAAAGTQTEKEEGEGEENDEDTDKNDGDDFDLETLTKDQLIDLNDTFKLGAELKKSMKIDDMRDVVRPLWVAHEAAEKEAAEKEAAAAKAAEENA